MGNFKVRVNSSDESKEVQDLLVKMGYHARENWNELGSIGGFIWADSDMTFCDNKIKYFDESPRKEITLLELRAMVNPMKEYLDANRNYEFVLSTEKDDGFIEIPEGMNFAYKDEFNVHFTKMEMGYRDSVLVWQRGSEAESLVDWSNVINNAQQIFDHENAGKPSLNDQYAEIEQVRQTLNERESQYGSFKDVADTTAVFMDQFALGRMSSVQREALHMICSKLARIANGDPNHVDSWHDIAGYATLVVDDLES